MITETRQSRTRLIHYEHHRRRRRRRPHTLDNVILDKFNFICVPLHRDESRPHSSSSHTNLTMIQPRHFSTSTTSILPTPPTISTASRRVRFQFDENDKPQNSVNLNDHRHTRSSDDVRLAKNNSIHRVEFQIPIHQDINPWLNVDCSTLSSSLPAKTRSLTSQKIDIRHTNNNPMRLHGIAPFIQAEINHSTSLTNDSNQPQSQWYRQMYSHLHKPSEIPKEQQQNPYQPTYTFPDNFDGDFDRMEDYIRNTASKPIDKDTQKTPSSSIRITTSNLRDPTSAAKRNNGHIQKVTRFEDHYAAPVVTSPTERPKLNNDSSTPLSTSVNPELPSNPNPVSTLDHDQRSAYKRVLRGGAIPSNGLHKPSNNHKDHWHHIGD